MSNPDEEDFSDAKEANSQGSSSDGENTEQEERDSREREETVKCSLEGEKSEGGGDFKAKIFFRGRRSKRESQRRRD